MKKKIEAKEAFKIEKGIPCPERSHYPFKKMEVGDSFTFSENRKKLICASAHTYGRRHNMAFRLKGDRCWRIA